MLKTKKYKKTFFYQLLVSIYALLRDRTILKKKNTEYSLSFFSVSAFKEKIDKNEAFILGSGASINSLTQADYQKIKKGLSIGINRWYLHKFVPDIYMFEAPRLSDDDIDKYWLDSLFSQLEDHLRINPEVKVILKSLERGNFDFREFNPKIFNNRIFSILKLPIEADNIKSAIKLINYFHRLGLDRGKSIFLSFHFSAFVAINIAIAMGAKKIVLCGFDMSNNRYFWDEPSSWVSDRFILPVRSVNSELPHPTNDGARKNLLAEEIFREVIMKMCRNNNVELYVQNTNSILYPNIPAFSWQ